MANEEEMQKIMNYLNEMGTPKKELLKCIGSKKKVFSLLQDVAKIRDTKTRAFLFVSVVGTSQLASLRFGRGGSQLNLFQQVLRNDGYLENLNHHRKEIRKNYDDEKTLGLNWYHALDKLEKKKILLGFNGYAGNKVVVIHPKLRKKAREETKG